ncbi:MAG: hypothetical protein E6G69_14555 [Alphaproteobacteria bacterium]|nr:MAG: hypothetical protein E6G69_14555 [Alphaproteobacteria bacterium]
MADLVVIGFPNEAKADEGNDSYRPVFSGNQDRTHESRMDKSTRPLSALVFAFALWAVMPPSIAAASTASDTVREFYQTLLYNMQNGPSVGQRGRVARLAPVVPRVFDIPYMTQLAIGPTWMTLPEPQRRQVLQAFERYITAVYAERFDKYSGERLEVIGEQPTSHGTMVKRYN